MAKNVTVFAANNRVDHAVYGSGTIVETNERHTTIDFDGVGPKKFLTSMVKLAPSDMPPPVKPARAKKKVAR